MATTVFDLTFWENFLFFFLTFWYTIFWKGLLGVIIINSNRRLCRQVWTPKAAVFCTHRTWNAWPRRLDRRGSTDSTKASFRVTSDSGPMSFWAWCSGRDCKRSKLTCPTALTTCISCVFFDFTVAIFSQTISLNRVVLDAAIIRETSCWR